MRMIIMPCAQALGIGLEMSGFHSEGTTRPSLPADRPDHGDPTKGHVAT